MNIVIDGMVFQIQGTGGISRLFREILPRVCDLDNAVTVNIMTCGRSRAKMPAHPRIRHHRLLPIDDALRPHRYWRPILEAARAAFMRAGFNGLEGDIWHSTYYTGLSSLKKPTVVTVYDMIHERFIHFFDKKHDERFRLQKERCVRAADAIICISETTKKDLVAYYGLDESRITVIPLAASEIFKKDERADTRAFRLPSRPFVLYVGDRSPYKNFDELFKAYQSWEHRKDIALVVVGPPWSNREKARLSEKNLDGGIDLFSSADDYDLCALYNRALAFVYPSLYEGFGIPLLEAMACGCPVVASRIPTTVEIMGEQAIYFDVGQTADLIGALNIARREGRDSARTKEGLLITKKYSWERAAGMTLAVYRALSR